MYSAATRLCVPHTAHIHWNDGHERCAFAGHVWCCQKVVEPVGALQQRRGESNVNTGKNI